MKRGGCTSSRIARPAQQLRQLGEVRRHPSGLVLGQQLGRRASAPTRLTACDRGRITAVIGVAELLVRKFAIAIMMEIDLL